MSPLFARLLLRCCLVAGLLPGAATSSASTSYRGDAPVQSQSADERAIALQAALADIIGQLTSDSEAVSRPDVRQAIATAARHPVWYEYQRDGSGATRLVAQFDADSINTLLHRFGLGATSTGDGASTWTPSDATIRVVGVRSATDFARLMRYLGSLDVVRSVTPEQAEGESLRIRLSLASDIGHFLDQVQTGSLLRVDDPRASAGIDATLGFAR